MISGSGSVSLRYRSGSFHHHAKIFLKNRDSYCFVLFCWSVTFWYGAGTTDPCLWPRDPDPAPGPAIFIPVCQDAKEKLFSFKVFLLITFWRYIYIIFSFSKIKRHKRVTNLFLLFLLDGRRIRIRTSD